MIARNILKQGQSLKFKIIRLPYYFARVRGAKQSWNKRHKSVLNAHPGYRNPCSKDLEKEHRHLWSPFRRKCDITTLRICKNISGVADPRYIPEDIFVSDIEPTLITDTSVDYIGIKSFYNRWFEKGIFPADIFHRVDGQYLDSGLNSIDYEDVEKIVSELNFPVVLKPNKDTYGGMNVEFPQNEIDLLSLAVKRNDYVVQKMILQHNFFDRYNKGGLNTVKVFLYRSVKDNRVHVLSMALRMGRGGSLDNETAGGIVSFINKDGTMNGYATDKFGTKYSEHPDTNFAFDSRLPDYEELKRLSIEIGKKVFYTRVMALDACYDQDCNWRILEVNTSGLPIRFAQYGGALFFGEFTEEVIDYCRINHWALKE